jgi:hypothetical protein
MKIYVLVTSSENTGIYSSLDLLTADLTTKFKSESLDRVEEWDLDAGFVRNINVSKKTIITIED